MDFWQKNRPLSTLFVHTSQFSFVHLKKLILIKSITYKGGHFFLSACPYLVHPKHTTWTSLLPFLERKNVSAMSVRLKKWIKIDNKQ
jgi:hypothetical protein